MLKSNLIFNYLLYVTLFKEMKMKKKRKTLLVNKIYKCCILYFITN